MPRIRARYRLPPCPRDLLHYGQMLLFLHRLYSHISCNIRMHSNLYSHSQQLSHQQIPCCVQALLSRYRWYSHILCSIRMHSSLCSSNRLPLHLRLPYCDREDLISDRLYNHRAHRFRKEDIRPRYRLPPYPHDLQLYDRAAYSRELLR